jgi:Na+-driven multidrug efflux pump
VASAVIKGTGQQKWGAIITFAAYIVFSIPTALILTEDAQGIRGLWYAALFAVCFNFAAYSYFYTKIDWKVLIS